MVTVRVRVRVADCCIQTAGDSDKMRINHVIKTDQWLSAPEIRPAPHFVVSHLYSAVYGRNFRGAGDRSDQCSVKALVNKKFLSLYLAVASPSASERFESTKLAICNTTPPVQFLIQLQLFFCV